MYKYYKLEKLQDQKQYYTYTYKYNNTKNKNFKYNNKNKSKITSKYKIEQTKKKASPPKIIKNKQLQLFFNYKKYLKTIQYQITRKKQNEKRKQERLKKKRTKKKRIGKRYILSDSTNEQHIALVEQAKKTAYANYLKKYGDNAACGISVRLPNMPAGLGETDSAGKPDAGFADDVPDPVRELAGQCAETTVIATQWQAWARANDLEVE